MTLRGTSTHPCTPWMDAQIPHRRRDALHASEKHRQPTPYPPTLLLVFSFIHRVLSYFCVSQGASGAVARKLLSSPLTAPHTVNSKKQFPDRHRSDAKTPGRQASHIWWPEAFLPAVLAKARRDDRAVVLLLPGVPRTMAALFAVRVDCKVSSCREDEELTSPRPVWWWWNANNNGRLCRSTTPHESNH